MKIKLTYEEATRIIRSHLGLDALNPDIEIEPVEYQHPSGNPGQLEWEPDGETPPPNADAFIKWTESVWSFCYSDMPNTPYIKAEHVGPGDCVALFESSGNHVVHVNYRSSDWQEYTDDT